MVRIENGKLVGEIDINNPADMEIVKSVTNKIIEKQAEEECARIKERYITSGQWLVDAVERVIKSYRGLPTARDIAQRIGPKVTEEAVERVLYAFENEGRVSRKTTWIWEGI